jgi:NADPH:quinone reductase
MRAVVVTRTGGPEVLEVQDRPAPRPEEGQLLVDVEAVGVNYRDVYERNGAYARTPPFVAGVEGAGTVTAVGENVTELSTGDRVAWKDTPGSYAEQIALDATQAVPIPNGISTEQAAAVLLQGLTAHYLATSTYPVKPDDTVLVHAAAGGVGLLLTQMVKSRGGRVIATTSTNEKASLALEAGADDVIDYDTFAERVRELTDGSGVSVVYDGVGKATFDESLRSLQRRGTMVLYGAASGPVPPFDPMRLEREGSLFLTRPTLRHYTAARADLLEHARRLFALIAERKLDVRIGGRYPLEDAGTAHENLEARRTTGKLLLLPR